MKPLVKQLNCLFLLVTVILSFHSQSQGKSLAELYKGKKIRLVPILTITSESTPEENLLINPSSVIDDETGNIYISDSKTHDIKKFSPKGSFIKAFGRKGSGPGDLYLPSFLVALKGTLYVWEGGNRRISRFSYDGKFLGLERILERKSMTKMRALGGKQLAISFEKDMFRNNISTLFTLCIYSTDLKLQKTIYSHPIIRDKYITEPERTNIPQPFQGEVLWDVSPSGKVIIGFSNDYTIEIHNGLAGKMGSFSHEYKPVPITKKDKEAFMSDIVNYNSNGDINKTLPDYMIKNIDFPDHKPPYTNILVDSEENILVRTSQPWDKRNNMVLDTFDKNGRFIQTVEIAFNTTPTELMGGRNKTFWQLIYDADGEPSIFHFRVEAQQ